MPSSSENEMRVLETDAPVVDLLAAIHQGNVTALRALLDSRPGLASATIVRPSKEDGRPDFTYPALCAATDWPGHYPQVQQTIRLLIDAGADVNGRCSGAHTETPLHWAASTDDVEALDALLDAGADIEAAGAVIAGGTSLADAVAFGQWNAARRLVERGAQTNLWQAAALGLLDRVEESIAAEPPSSDQVTAAFWLACHGGQLSTAEYLLARGADLNWIGYDGLTPLDAAKRSGRDELAAWLRARDARSAVAERS
jgi:ankyrin repeat protein